ncbi:hypothetical protein COT70_00160 [candidate division WWE3 bacterium CG09_land_8_20_14_0_10_47_33]|uniref:UDP-N-acetylglucosamine--N-acetylmuramyl-(pentapeptide) pyrophosphoryl-undecaprenol N-acetylglucosamine transferase n=1 Tax=candidate division WWE3 bacterium CG_4_9_14_0_2_um_filter_48_10 TaxID=1975078 RepID=A0A2M8EJ51_UNCKA|nr:MAG: hypothetical protein COT70_00160 [candidate division WWE3 bacterium CG09_land_8_20_14_0_10_47_33]PJC22781.1 MAG: hypothetical protein CO059_01660 [candidate division WWE3 bacterium CG_4_9_14_0_2_um_filter_48_10]PJE52314.1 MAG: hypothetical protein COV28_00375 [candidate division WWE3 bacterium CG10_big_fil_rev_8_21_14_0_10_48_23]
MNYKPMRIIVTGGHHTPALAVMEELTKRGNFCFFWVGWATQAEYRVIKKLDIPLFNLQAGKLYRTASVGQIFKIPLGFFHAFYLLIKIRPRLIISFGGYLAAPVVLAGFLLRIPAVTHEQTVVSGWANRFIGFFAKKVFVSWERSRQFFPRGKTVVTGNPVREAIFEVKTNRFRFPENLPTIYITGGKQGAHVINEVVREALSEFLSSYNVIHQTGFSEVYPDYQKILVLRRQLPKKLSRRYLVQEFFGDEEIGAVYKAADLVVARAGANTVVEAAALGKPAIFIPIPWASHNEQMENAKLLERIGSARILPQEKLSPSPLLKEVEWMVKNLKFYQERGEEAKKLVDPLAAKKIAEEIIKVIQIKP